MEKFYPTQGDLHDRAFVVANEIWSLFGEGKPDPKPIKMYPIPRGGVPAAYLIKVLMPRGLEINIVDNESDAEIFVDDLIDSGATLARYTEGNDKPFFALYDKREKDIGWIVFPWEETDTGSAEDIITRQLQYIGEDPGREGLIETPSRVIKTWDHIFSGYGRKPEDVIKVFEEKKVTSELILLRNIELYSMCEHHILPFIGRAHVAYIPKSKKIIGASKLAHLVEIYSRRLQVQERIGDQITSALMKLIPCKGAACIIDAQHLCMQMRGVEKQHSSFTTSSLKGVFIEGTSKGIAARAELLQLIRM